MFAEFHSLFESIDDPRLIESVQAGFTDFDVLALLSADLERLKQEMAQTPSTNEVQLPQSSNVHSFFASSVPTQQESSDDENDDLIRMEHT